MTPPTILVLCAIDPGEPLRRCTGQSAFLGEAGLGLAARGVRLLCAEPGADVGHRPLPGAWGIEAIDGVVAVYDRYRHGGSRDLQAWCERGVPVANPPAFRALCDDKLAFARWANGRGLPVPETVPAADPVWRGWTAAFVKPRRGWGGEGVRPPGERPPDEGEIVQRAVIPRVPGESIRLLLQRDPDRGWIVAGGLVRLAAGEAGVASLQRGAAAHPLSGARLDGLGPLVDRLVRGLADAPEGDRIVEVGVDLVDTGEGPWILEWNARPGRSFHLAGRPDLRRDALLRPFRMLLSWGT